MKIIYILQTISLLLLLLSGCSRVAEPNKRNFDLPVFDIPQKSGVIIDRNKEDWNQTGLIVKAMAPPGGRVHCVDDLAASL
jgi:hypothetical protein